MASVREKIYHAHNGMNNNMESSFQSQKSIERNIKAANTSHHNHRLSMQANAGKLKMTSIAISDDWHAPGHNIILYDSVIYLYTATLNGI